MHVCTCIMNIIKSIIVTVQLQHTFLYSVQSYLNKPHYSTHQLQILVNYGTVQKNDFSNFKDFIQFSVTRCQDILIFNIYLFK